MSIKLQDIKSSELRRRIEDILSTEVTHPKPQPSVSPAPKRIRQSAKPKLNRLEAEFLGILRCNMTTEPPVRSHDLTFRLGNGVRYTPDFTVVTPLVERKMTCWEVKGPYARDDSIVKVKVAAHEYPEIRWVLVWKENGQWREQEVLP